MRKLQAAAQTAKTQGGGSIEARDKWNQSLHYSRLIDATLPEVLSIVSQEQSELYDKSISAE